MSPVSPVFYTTSNLHCRISDVDYLFKSHSRDEIDSNECDVIISKCTMYSRIDNKWHFKLKWKLWDYIKFEKIYYFVKF